MGRFIHTDNEGVPKELNEEQIKKDSKYDGFKTISTTNLAIEEILNKYKDLFEVEHSFMALKTELEIRPMYHWTNKRIEGHIVLSFIAYTMLNYIRNLSKMLYREIVRTLDKMQMSEIKEDDNEALLYLRSKLDENQKKIANFLKIVIPNDVTTPKAINQVFI